MIVSVVECENGAVTAFSLEMLTLARKLAAQLQTSVEAVVLGGDSGAAASLQSYGVTQAHVVTHPRLTAYAPEAWAQAVLQVLQALHPQVVLAPGSERGAEVLAHVAARLNLALAANCLDAAAGEPLTVTRQRWGGSLLEEARLTGAIKLLTVAPGALVAEPAPVDNFSSVLVTPTLSDKDFRVQVTEQVASSAGKISLAEARLVVGGGRGVGSAEGFKVLEDLAGVLGGAVGCSRAVTSNGWRPHMEQIGQTGTRITADVYIACGVSGATQHIVGCKGAKRILAINTDPDASIMAHADYAIIGDLHEVVPALTAAIRAAKG